MKKKLLAAALLAAGTGMAHAQSSVSIYGLIDLGLTYYSNAAKTGGGGASLLRMDSGIAQGSRIGFKGTEDLGGGLNAFFTLETGFGADDGSLGQGGLLFGRQSFVGLGSKDWGSISAGRQYDFMANIGAQYAMGALSPAGSFAWGTHADAAHSTALNDHIYGGDRTNNSIKYNSAKFGGFSFGAMLGLGEVAGNNNAGRTVSALGQYDAGAFSGALAYTDIKSSSGASATRIYGGGARYQIGAFTPFGVITQVKNTDTNAKATTYELGTVYALTPLWDLAAAYQFQKRNQGVGNAQALVATVDYKISKRTDLYVGAVYDRDKGYNAYPVFGGGIQSSTGNQSALRLGMRHRF
ncbi:MULTISPECIES: porin [Herbaspirillum]|jgi:predicted porin|nr:MULTISPECIES: porin [Herbaspirillum]MBN9356780.1 porin [Herbaspirillum huttiense]MCP3655621.1 porin [Herbaspirillum sp.]MCP3945390.1 porin [Herbaspirillum sp.]MCP4034093.1 porin [Herbaspirillum sp.]MCP4034482.1 porin [Herbaspirillum sp.]